MADSKHTPGPWHTRSVYKHGSDWAAQVWNESNTTSVAFVLQGGMRARELAEANARLIAAVPDLLSCQTMGAEVNTPDFLDWIADRLVEHYGESPNVDFVLSLRDRARAGRAAIAKATGSA